MNASMRACLVFAFDLLAVCVAWVGAFLIRFNLDWPGRYEELMLSGLAVLLPVQVLACRWAGLYRGMWVFASLPDLQRVLKAVAVSGLALVAFAALYRGAPNIPRSILLLYPLLLLLLMGGGRATWRMWKEHRLYGSLKATGKPVVVVGAGTGGAMLVRELERSPDWRVVALVDDDPAKQGRELHSCSVAGAVADLPDVLRAYKAQHVILAMPSAPRQTRGRVAELATEAHAQLFTVPGLEDLMGGKVAINAMRPVDIEDLLGREPVRIETDNVEAMVAGRTVLITGAGGSIGGELCRQIARFSPARIVLFEASEFALYQIEQSLLQQHPGVPFIPLAGDVKDTSRVDEVMAQWQPALVFHAAAYKHVPLMEVHNAWQAVRNNVLGTLTVAEAAQRHACERFILISTDKAVNPTNVMGATKRLAEMVCQALHSAGGTTQFEMVRFGNVLGSAGSVIPRFREQIAAGGPVTVTHPEITRYFMSIPEAAQLVLQAAAMGKGGEIFVLDMGEPVKIVDLARNMIRLCGLKEEDIRIEFTGLRPGEKLYEELLADGELTRETRHPKLRIACARQVPADCIDSLSRWLGQDGTEEDETVRKVLQHWIPEYGPVSNDTRATGSQTAAANVVKFSQA